MRIFICLCFIMWICISHGQCNAQANGTIRTNRIDSPTWYVDSTGSPSLSTIDTTKGYLWKMGTGHAGIGMYTYTPKQNVIIQGWDTTNIIYLKKEKTGWDARASADTVYFRIPPKKIIIGRESYSTLFLNGHWVLLWDPKSK